MGKIKGNLSNLIDNALAGKAERFPYEHMRQSASLAFVDKYGDDDYVVRLRSILLDGVTCNLIAQFPNFSAATEFVARFGFSQAEWTDKTERRIRDTIIL